MNIFQFDDINSRVERSIELAGNMLVEVARAIDSKAQAGDGGPIAIGVELGIMLILRSLHVAIMTDEVDLDQARKILKSINEDLTERFDNITIADKSNKN